MNFFRLIQQSAPHIYHSALPLSPMSSTFRFRTLGKKTRITGFHGRPDAWGVVVRTVTASSKGFTCMATFGHRIAAAWDDGSVAIYDSVTGVLRLYLSLADPVQAIGGSPDGSVLFCAHKTPSITTWDMQTGGLIHTFVMERSAEDIAVSSKGRYLACGLPDESVGVWKVSDKLEGAAIWTTSPATRFCWLGPEEHLAVSTRMSVRIWNVVDGTVLGSCTMRYSIHRMVYSQKLDQLAIMARSATAFINPQTGKRATFQWNHHNLSCFAFSQTSEELVCGTETRGLQLFNVSTQCLKHIEHPDTMTSVSCLQNGTVVANFAGSGIQLLDLDGYSPSQQPTISPLTVHAFDRGRIIAISQTTHDQIIFLGTTSMSCLLEIPVQNRATTLCASCKNRTVVGYFEEGNQGFLQLFSPGPILRKWTAKVDGVPEIGRISPTAVRLVTLHIVGRLNRICVWDARDGQLEARLEYTSAAQPLDIEFASDTKFSLQYSDHHRSYTVHSQGLDELTTPLPPRGWQKKWDLSVDDTREWVVRGLERVCWIPPGYIRSVQSSYCWAGSSLVMIGQDGILRKITFENHLEG